MFLPNDPPPPPPRERHERHERHDKPSRNDDYAPRAREGERTPRPPRTPHDGPDAGMQTYRIEVGHEHRVKPGNIVGAIANEAELEARYIGRVDIRDDYTLVDLPEGMPPELLQFLGNVRVAGRPIKMRLATDDDLNQPARRPSFDRKPRFDDDGSARPRKPGGFKPGGNKPGGFNKRPGGFNKGGPKKPRDPR